MEPCSFDEANLNMGPPVGMSEDEVRTLRVYTGPAFGYPRTIVSCFKLTADELEEVNRSGRVWLTLLASGMPPVILTAHKPELA